MKLMGDQRPRQADEGESKVITLCGSTKFEAAFAQVNQRLTMEGCVVISLGMFSLPDLAGYDWTVGSSDLKGRLGRVHFQKIRMADEVRSCRCGRSATPVLAPTVGGVSASSVYRSCR